MKRIYKVFWLDPSNGTMDHVHTSRSESDAIGWAEQAVASGTVYYIQPCLKGPLFWDLMLSPTEITAVWKDGGEVFRGSIEEYKRFKYALKSRGKPVLVLSNSEPYMVKGTLVGFISVSQSKQPLPKVQDEYGHDWIAQGIVLLDMPLVRATIAELGPEKAWKIMTRLNQMRLTAS